MREIEIGPVAAFAPDRFPAAIALEGKKCFLVHDGQQYQVFSSVCPHKGGEVADQGICFECPQHGWRFDRVTGRGLNASARLAAYPVVERNGMLLVQLGAAQADTGRRRSVRLPRFTLSLHAHACFEVALDDFSLLTDPWLDGPAFMGAWTQYPPPLVKPRDLAPSAILITHEHSDHFHEPTLEQFPRDTAVYAPDFPNQRILKRLAAMGFTRVTPLQFGETVEIGPAVRVTAYEPAGVWNDAIYLIDVDGFRILNLNDAGLNQNIPPKVGVVDLIAAQFSVGASGYPWTWDNVAFDEKVRIMTMQVPARALAKIVHEDVSWDELHIGYWGRYNRRPDVYTPGFWRLLQAPYYQRDLAANGSPRRSPGQAIDEASVVAALVESHGDQAVRILRRYGLYCAGCHRSTYETLQTAARQHGLDPDRAESLVRELKQACG